MDNSDKRETEEKRDLVVKPVASNDPEQLVRQFHQVYGLPIQTDQPSVARERIHMRMALILEETAELVAAVYGEKAGAHLEAAISELRGLDDNTRDTVGAADALADMVYVIYGAALESGINLPAVLQAVQASNMSKLGPDGKPIYREDGKVLKGEAYFPPDVEGALKQKLSD